MLNVPNLNCIINTSCQEWFSCCQLPGREPPGRVCLLKHYWNIRIILYLQNYTEVLEMTMYTTLSYHNRNVYNIIVEKIIRRCRGGRCPLPGNEAITKVHNLFMFSSSCFCLLDRSKAAFPEALSWKPEGETQSNSALQQYSTKQYNQAAIISHPKEKSNIFPSFFFSFFLPILY